jgi:hypothetical protein
VRKKSLGFEICVILGIAFVACAGPDTIDDQWRAPDASSAIPCDPLTTNLQHNTDHCGSCDNECHIDNTDRCVAGVCVCGSEEECAPGFDCRSARCVASDPSGDVCEFDPECPVGYGCVEGRCTSLDCRDEVCDGFDNDCDTEVDEGNAPGDAPLAQYCGAPTTIIPPCRPGVQVCVDGAWGECLGGVLPIAETGLLLCNRIDDDCDGCVDSALDSAGMCVPPPPAIYDIVFIVDVSGSMGAAISRVKAAVRSFSATYSGSPDFAFALVTTGYYSSYPNIETNLTLTYADFIGAVDGLDHWGSGFEGTWDAAYLVMRGELRDSRRGMSRTTPIAWRDGSTRIIVTLTDEDGQSYLTPTPISERVMCDAATRGEVLVFFTPPAPRSDFDDCGQWFDLYDYAAIAPNLTSVFVDPCP